MPFGLDKSSPYNKSGLMNQIPAQYENCGLDESSPYILFFLS
jgi:hypothetical protein